MTTVPSHHYTKAQSRHSSTQRHKPHKPSLSGAMTWLAHSYSNTASHPSKQYFSTLRPSIISEPKLVDSHLGSGVIIVKTPQEALVGTPFFQEEEAIRRRTTHSQQADIEGADYDPRPYSSLESPPLPPLPPPESSPGLFSKDKLSQSTRRPKYQSPEPPLQSPPLNCQPRTPQISEHTPVPPSPPQPPFEPILLSPIPSLPADPTKTVVMLETSTQTYRTTLSTLTSRKSHLTDYFVSLFESASNVQGDPETCSVYSQSSSFEDNMDSFNSIFRNHLTASGILTPSSSTIHLFLDRPSEPYAHILSFLRIPPSPDYPSTLPRPVQLSAGVSPSRMEALLELRDEASFLQLEELYKLCTDELSHRHKHLQAARNARRKGENDDRVSSNHTSDHNILHLREEECGPLPHTVHPPTPTPTDCSSPSSRAGSAHEGGAGGFSHHPDVRGLEARKDGHTSPKVKPPASWI